MGLVKVRVIAPGKVKLVHQLGQDGKAYAEDVTIESDVPGRLSHLEQHDGKVGTLSYGFSPYPDENVPDGIQFPE